MQQYAQLILILRNNTIVAEAPGLNGLREKIPLSFGTKWPREIIEALRRQQNLIDGRIAAIAAADEARATAIASRSAASAATTRSATATKVSRSDIWDAAASLGNTGPDFANRTIGPRRRGQVFTFQARSGPDRPIHQITIRDKTPRNWCSEMGWELVGAASGKAQAKADGVGVGNPDGIPFSIL